MRSLDTAMLSLQFGPCIQLWQWYLLDSDVIRTPGLLDRPCKYARVNIYDQYIPDSLACKYASSYMAVSKIYGKRVKRVIPTWRSSL